MASEASQVCVYWSGGEVKNGLKWVRGTNVTMSTWCFCWGLSWYAVCPLIQWTGSFQAVKGIHLLLGDGDVAVHMHSTFLVNS